jgi:ELWxxDGT repeat protein
MVADINGTTGSDAGDLTDAAGTLYFTAYTAQGGFQVWQSDGTAAGTVADTALNGGAAVPSDLAPSGTSLYFTAPGATLWKLS